MIIHLTGYERDQYQKHFELLLRLRHAVFVVARQWTLPSTGGVERDQYDSSDAHYFFAVDDDGQPYSHVRLTPTLRHSLLADYFPHLVEGQDNPRGATVYEATRYIVLPQKHSKEANRRAKAEILGSAMEWALANGVTHLQTVIDSNTLPTFLEISAECRPLGLSHPYGGGPKVRGGGEAVAIRCPATAKVIHDIRSYGNLPCGRCQDCAFDGRKAA